MLFRSLGDSLGNGTAHHFCPPRPGVDMAMAAGLVAFAAHVDLQRLQTAAAQAQPCSLKPLLESIHLGFRCKKFRLRLSQRAQTIQRWLVFGKKKRRTWRSNEKRSEGRPGPQHGPCVAC